DAIRRYYEVFPACGGGRLVGGRPEEAPHHWFAGELAEEEIAAREAAAHFVGAARAEEIVWVRNTTEAVNLLAHALGFEPGDEVATSELEHNSNQVPWQMLEARLRREAAQPDLPVRRVFDRAPDGAFDLGRALAAITSRTKLVALGHRSNLDGSTIADEDLVALVRRAHAVGAKVFLDAAQSVPHRPVDVGALGVDFLAFSFHKLCGPSGLGVLYGRMEALERLEPFLVGGDTVADVWPDAVEFKAPPGRFEAGLQHYAGMLGARAAIDYVTHTVGLDAIQAHDRFLGGLLEARLRPLTCEHFRLLGPEGAGAESGIVTMASGLGAVINAIERLADEESNVMLRKGMFCANAYLHRHFDAAGSAHNNLRASVYLYNTEAECDALCRVVERVVRDPLAHLDGD
ncbi:MAG: aminotransferase class V-fold PLP-dependent enzyme, partial [Planctomycetota bacterium]